MPTKINKHFFHEFYSNAYNNSIRDVNKLWTRNPLHVTKSYFGGNDPFLNGAYSKPQVFQTEEEAVEYYKKTLYGKIRFNYMKSKGIKFCKNYFVVSEVEFDKYKNYFNRMIKGAKMTSEVEIVSEGTACSYCSESKSTSRPVRDKEKNAKSDTITLNNPYGSSYYSVSVGADDIGYMNGKNIGSGYSEDKGNKASSLSFYGKDTGGDFVGVGAGVTWYKPQKYKQKLRFKTDFDSTKIFDIPELEKRIGANSLIYYTYPSILEDKIKEELRYLGGSLYFKDNWKFNKKVFRDIFISDYKKFNNNSTLLNDPVLLFLDEYTNKYFLSYYNTFVGSTMFEEILNSTYFNKQKQFTKTFTKFGESILSMENNNSVVNNASSEGFNLNLSDIIYIKSKKIYLCFVDMNYRVSFGGSIVYPNTECPNKDNKYQYLGDMGAGFEFTTNDYDQIEFDKPIYGDTFLYRYQESSCSELKIAKCKIDNFNLTIGNKTFQIECLKSEPNEFTVNNSQCKDLSKKDQLFNTKTTVNIIKKPTISIIEWQKSDFDKANTFPPKVE